MELELLILSIFCIIAGIFFLVMILTGNKDKVTGKTPKGFLIPAIGLFLVYSVCIPLYLYFYDPVLEVQQIGVRALEWIMGILLGISATFWTYGKIVTR